MTKVYSPQRLRTQSVAARSPAHDPIDLRSVTRPAALRFNKDNDEEKERGAHSRNKTFTMHI